MTMMRCNGWETCKYNCDLKTPHIETDDCKGTECGWTHTLSKCVPVETDKPFTDVLMTKAREKALGRMVNWHNPYKPDIEQTPIQSDKPQWQDRPDKAGWWWTSRIKNREWTTPNMMHLTTKDDANVILDLGYKWLYIPEPELPEVE